MCLFAEICWLTCTDQWVSARQLFAAANRIQLILHPVLRVTDVVHLGVKVALHVVAHPVDPHPALPAVDAVRVDPQRVVCLGDSVLQLRPA